MQLVLIFLVACLGYLNSFFASSLLNRPIVMGALTGLVLGHWITGIEVGATLELVFLGAQAIGASNPPDMVSGSVLGTSYVVLAHSSVATAVALAVPISMLMQMVWNLLMMLVVPVMAAKADKYASQENYSGVDAMHYLAVFSQTIILASLNAVSYFLGSAAIKAFVTSIPSFVNNGLNWAMGIIPALGFALLAKMILTKKTIVFLFFGFLLAACLKLNIIAVVSFGCILAFVLVFSHDSTTSQKQEVDDNEF